MPFNSLFSWYIGKRMKRIDDYKNNPHENQEKIFHYLISQISKTEFGLEKELNLNTHYSEFKEKIPLQDYGTLKSLIDLSIEGKTNLLWPGKTKWFAKSSGTTADRVKKLPITKELLEFNHYAGGKDLLAQYYANHPKRKLYNVKHLIIGGSGQITKKAGGVFIGDLSAIIINNLPAWTEVRRTPKKEIALLGNWEEKLEKMAHSVIHENIGILAGIPSWTSLLLKKVLEISGKNTIHEVWPNLELYIHGGMNFNPYRSTFSKLIGKNINYVESYNASEGYFGMQDQTDKDELLLLTNSQIFYEFISMSEFKNLESETISLQEVAVDKEYALVISTSAGLWRYLIGDTIRFTSINPYRFNVSGRISHYMNAFGEKMIVDHVEKAIAKASSANNARIQDYTVAPFFNFESATGGHEWIIEFEEEPKDYKRFKIDLDDELKIANADYEAKRIKNINIEFPRFVFVPKGTFYEWFKRQKKLGGQHKIPRLTNDRKVIEQLLEIIS